jgi:hypothetical protein
VLENDSAGGKAFDAPARFLVSTLGMTVFGALLLDLQRVISAMKNLAVRRGRVRVGVFRQK